MYSCLENLRYCSSVKAIRDKGMTFLYLGHPAIAGGACGVSPGICGARSKRRGRTSLMVPRQRRVARIFIMIALHPQYVTDEKGTRIAVQLPAEEFAQLLEELEMAEDVAAYDRAKTEGGDPIPFERYLAERTQG
jgi:hypothetical protein